MQAGFSADGYIIDQDCFSDYPYRTITSDINGCGWIAAYNVRRALGQDADFDEVRAEMDAMFPVRVPGPTTNRVMCRYLEKYVSRVRFVRGRAASLEAAGSSAAGMLHYWEGKEPHFVSFLRLPDGRYRFFNVADGLEDYVSEMDAFIRTRSTHGFLFAITAE